MAKTTTNKNTRKRKIIYGATAALFVSLFSLSLFARAGRVYADIGTYSYDFNSASDADELMGTQFRASEETEGNFQLSTDGLGATQAVDTTSYYDVWTTRQAFAVPTDGQTYKISGYFYNAGGDGYGGLGFSTNQYNDPSPDAGYPMTLSGLGMLFHGGGGDFENSGDSASTVSWPSGDLGSQWYKFLLRCTQTAQTVMICASRLRSPTRMA